MQNTVPEHPPKPKLNSSVITYLILAGCITAWAIIGNSPSHKITCTDKAVPYTSTQVDDPTLAVGTTQITTQGVNGVEHVCKTGTDVIKEDSITTDKVDQVVSNGTEQPVPTYVPVQRSTGCAVTLCADGSCSFSTGRGTCSHHGGEAY